MFWVIMRYINIIYVPATTLALALTLDLGENRLDQARASKSDKINTVFQHAIAKLRGDV